MSFKPRKWNIVMASIMAVAMPFAAMSATEDGQFSVRGLGSQTCEQFSAALAGESGREIGARASIWVAGWLSHANRVTPGIYDVFPAVETSAVAEIVRRVCTQNPTAMIETVLESATRSVAKGASTSMSDVDVVTFEDQSVRVRSETLRKLQDVLVAKGLLEARQADGKFGPATQKAIAAFQKSVSLPETGLPDPFTVFVAFANE